MEHELREITLGGYRLSVDAGRTRAYYAAQPPYECPCAGCRNFVQAVRHLPREAKELFDALGLDPAKPEEVCSYPGTREEAHGGAWYHICGTILEGGTPPEGQRFSEWVQAAEVRGGFYRRSQPPGGGLPQAALPDGYRFLAPLGAGGGESGRGVR